MVTIKDIAEMTHLSPSTVSRVLNHHPAISESTRKLVMECVEKLQYTPNRNAQNLVRQSSRTIAFMIPDISDTYFSSAAVGVEEILHQNRYDIVYINTNREPARVLGLLNQCREYQYGGVFVTPDVWDDALLAAIHAMPVPVISLRRKPPYTIPEIPYVDSDHYTGAREATEYLFSLGHTEIALITANTLIYNERQRGYEEAIRNHRLKKHVSCLKTGVPSSMRFRAGYQAAKELLEGEASISAILSTDDRMAIGVLEYLAETGRSAPQDVSVIGCDDRPEGQLYPFQLTTIRQDILEIGRNAAQMMVRMIEDREYQPVSLSLKPRLIVRNSTGPKK